MKKILSLLLTLALLTAPTAASAENWWDAIGPAEVVEAPDQSPEPTERPKLNLRGLLNGLFGKDDEPREDDELQPDIRDSEEGDEPVYVEEDEPIHEEGDDAYREDFLFDSDVSNITGKSYGGEVQYAPIGNWVVAYGNCDDHFCVFGWNENNYEYHILAETVVSNIIPLGDAFAYYGEVKSGSFGWMVRNPNEEKPVSLGLNELNSVFWSDEDYLYYYTYGKGSGVTYNRMDHQGKNKKELGKLNGRGIAMTPEGDVVVFNSSKNRVELYRDGEHETLYAPEDEISNVLSTGENIWVIHWDYFGLLQDGDLDFRFPGHMKTYAATTDQIFVVLDDGGIRLNVTMLNDAYQAYAIVGQVVAQDNLTAEMTPGWYNRIVVWGARESLEFYTPYDENWLPYGYYDVASAKEAGYRPYK